jgi:hypothetical protein
LLFVFYCNDNKISRHGIFLDIIILSIEIHFLKLSSFQHSTRLIADMYEVN